MDTRQQQHARDYNAISPSAKALVLLKGLTNIPFAKETAILVSLPGTYEPDVTNTDLAFWKRVVHFEIRYWSLDQLLAPLQIKNVLELSSGYSFRGLKTVIERPVRYIDTDLPNVIQEKQEFIKSLRHEIMPLSGTLEMRALNALDEEQFNDVLQSFPAGPIVIVNEGLLMYLDTEEKKRLCSIIRNVLLKRGGYWITGDIYIRSTLEKIKSEKADTLKELVDQQRIEENMFDSFDSAKAFFENLGFELDKEAELDLSKISSLKYLVQNSTEAQLAEMQQAQKVQASWRLKVTERS